VHLVATTVVRLVGPLAHEGLFRSWRAVCARCAWLCMERLGGSACWSARARSTHVGRREPGCTTQPLTDQRYAVGSRRVKPRTAHWQPPVRVAGRWPGRCREMPRSACGERVVRVARPGLGSHLTEVPYHPPGCVSVRWFPRPSPQQPPSSHQPRETGVHSLWRTLWRADGHGRAASAPQCPASQCQDPVGEGEHTSWSTPIRT
jgi:hypothetical protein